MRRVNSPIGLLLLFIGLIFLIGCNSGLPPKAWRNVGPAAGISADRADWVKIAVPKETGVPFVAYQNLMNTEAMVMKYNGTAWVAVPTDSASTGITATGAEWISLAMVHGDPCLLYCDIRGSEEAHVIRYTAGSWISIGSPAIISSGEARDTSLLITNNAYYAAFTDTTSGKSTVRRSQGWDAWQGIENETYATAADNGDLNSLCGYTGASGLYGDQPIYLAYRDRSSGQLYVKVKNAGSNWVFAGCATTAPVSQSVITALSTFYDKGVCYLAYCEEDPDLIGGYRLMVKKKAGSVWEKTGDLKPINPVGDVSLFVENDTLYVAYVDRKGTGLSAPQVLTVKRFNGISWEPLGGNICENSCRFISLAVYKGVPYVAYSDSATTPAFRLIVKKYD